MTKSTQEESHKQPFDDKTNPSWRVFKSDSEAGRLLSRLYGVKPNENKIRYPKLRSSGVDISDRLSWNQTNKREKVQRNVVKVPKVGQCIRQKENNKKPSLLHVSSIPRRKTEALCQETIKECQIKRYSYRPPMKAMHSTQEEKDRLCDINSYGGGCGLPEELTIRPKQAALEEKLHQDISKEQKEQRSLPDEIVKEIEERRAFQCEMEQNGAGDKTRDKIVKEISDRIKELMKLDPDKARVMSRSCEDVF